MIVFVHGVPETEAVWDRLRAELDRESMAVSLPGFGCARPAGFGATKDDYADWLVGELEGLGDPVHLVGHDWGALLTYRVATTRPDLLASWAADIGSVLRPDYVWHQFAQIWQTPGEGEAFFETQAVTEPARVAAGFELMGAPADDALAMAEAGDDVMASCILDLYRSATPNPAADWGSAFGPTAAPGLVLQATADPFDDPDLSTGVAAQLGAVTATLDGLGHWWAVQAPAVAARALTAFWSGLA